MPAATDTIRSAHADEIFRGGDEVPGGSELVRAPGVVALTRCVERKFHEAGETDPAGCLADVGRNAVFECVAVALCFGGGKWQFHRGESGFSGGYRYKFASRQHLTPRILVLHSKPY